jgi:hypothetical protein
MRILPASILIAFALSSGALAQSLVAPRSVPPDAQARRLAQDYAALQSQRLATAGGRDNLIAAALVGLADADGGKPAPGHDEVLQRLLAEHGGDALALYTVALACQHLPEPCAGADASARLVQQSPGNAVHWLLQPTAVRPDLERLHTAAEVGVADSHQSALMGIVHRALAGQAAPYEPDAGVDERALALALRSNEVASIPWPAYGPVMDVCSANAARAAAGQGEDALRTDCANLGHALFSDQGQQVVTRMYGGTLLRRFAPGTQLAAEALAFRRQYLWLDQLRLGGSAATRAQFDQDATEHGEWEALQRQAERSGSTRNPPADWLPEDRASLLLPEERGSGR